MEKVIVGQIVNTHGIKGELKVKASTDFVEERFATGAKLFLDYHNQDIEMAISSSYPSNSGIKYTGNTFGIHH